MKGKIIDFILYNIDENTKLIEYEDGEDDEVHEDHEVMKTKKKLYL